MDKFSIIIPVYNTEDYLEECLNSVITQTYKNLEIIVINDGSPKNADEICKRYVTLDSRIKYFYQKNQGVAVARNNGIANATGKYIFCVDSDDTIEKDFIAKIVKAFKHSDFDLVIVGKWLSQIDVSRVGALPTWGLAIKKEMLDRYPDIRFQEHMQPCEDGLFTHKLLALTNKIGKCPNARYIYRQNSQSSENNINPNKLFNDIPKWFEILNSFYDKYNNLDQNKIHILDFIENEPFGRLNNVGFSSEQSKKLFDIIHKFIKENNLLENHNELLYEEIFKHFLLVDSYENYILFKKLSNKKILIVENQNLINGQGGVEHVLCNMANVLSKENASVGIATMDKKKGKPYYDLNDNVVFFNCFKKMNFIKKIQRKLKKGYDKFLYELEYKNKLWNKFIQETNPDIIICFSLPTLLEISYQKEYNVPIILTVHGNPINDYTNRFDNRDDKLNALYEECYKSANIIQVLLDSYKTTIPSSFNGEVETIANIAPYINYTIDYNKRENFKITCVASLDDRKHQDLLIKAFAQIARTYEYWNVEIWGSGPNKEKYTDLIKKLNLTNRIALKGSTKKVCDVLRQTDVFVLPSLCEGWPLVLGEAMSMGIPCIGLACCDGTNEIIKDGYNGLLAENNILSLSEKLEELITDSKKRKSFGIQAQEDMQNYTEDIIWTKWKKLIVKTISQIEPQISRIKMIDRIFSKKIIYKDFRTKISILTILGIKIKRKIYSEKR